MTTKFGRSENSRLRNFADTVYDANRLILILTQACVALNRYTVGSLRSIASIAGMIHHSALCAKFHKITTLVANDLPRIL